MIIDGTGKNYTIQVSVTEAMRDYIENFRFQMAAKQGRDVTTSEAANTLLGIGISCRERIKKLEDWLGLLAD